MIILARVLVDKGDDMVVTMTTNSAGRSRTVLRAGRIAHVDLSLHHEVASVVAELAKPGSCGRTKMEEIKRKRTARERLNRNHRRKIVTCFTRAAVKAIMAWPEQFVASEAFPTVDQVV